MKELTEDDFTNEVLATFEDAESERFKEIMQSLIRHLPIFVREVQLTEEEWFEAIRFLTRTGQISGDNRSEEARLRWFCVDSAHRGHGLGGALLASALEFARGAGYRRIVLETFAELTGAARLYRTAGFEVTGTERRVFCGREVDVQWHALEL